MTKLPTNSDIITAISNVSAEVGAIKAENHTRHQENSKRLNAIETQVKYTNGRVKAMETKWERAEAVEAYKKNIQVVPSSSNPKDGVDWGKYMIWFVAFAASLIAIGQAIGDK